jgi:hypothetical protein
LCWAGVIFTSPKGRDKIAQGCAGPFSGESLAMVGTGAPKNEERPWIVPIISPKCYSTTRTSHKNLFGTTTAIPKKTKNIFKIRKRTTTVLCASSQSDPVFTNTQSPSRIYRTKLNGKFIEPILGIIYFMSRKHPIMTLIMMMMMTTIKKLKHLSLKSQTRMIMVVPVPAPRINTIVKEEDRNQQSTGARPKSNEEH